MYTSCLLCSTVFIQFWINIYILFGRAIESSDNTMKIVEKTLEKHPNLKIILMKRPPRHNNMSEESEFANFVLDYLGEKVSVRFGDRLVVAEHTSLYKEGAKDRMYGVKGRTQGYDGVHLRGVGGQEACTKSVVLILKKAGLEQQWQEVRSKNADRGQESGVQEAEIQEAGVQECHLQSQQIRSAKHVLGTNESHKPSGHKKYDLNVKPSLQSSFHTPNNEMKHPNEHEQYDHNINPSLETNFHTTDNEIVCESQNYNDREQYDINEHIPLLKSFHTSDNGMESQYESVNHAATSRFNCESKCNKHVNPNSRGSFEYDDKK